MIQIRRPLNYQSNLKGIKLSRASTDVSASLGLVNMQTDRVSNSNHSVPHTFLETLTMTSNSLTPRVALGELNTNTHATVSPANTLKQSDKSAITSTIEKSSGDQYLSPTKLRKTSTTPSRQSPKKEKQSLVFEDVQVVGIKRRYQAIDENSASQEHTQRAPGSVRIKKDGSTPDGTSISQSLTGDVSVDAMCVEEQQPDVSPTRDVEESYLSRSASPASSFASEDLSALNDSQNTVITEPDTLVSRVMAPEELRQVCFPISQASHFLTIRSNKK